MTLNVPERERWRVIAVTDRLPARHVPSDVRLDRLQNSGGSKQLMNQVGFV